MSMFRERFDPRVRRRMPAATDLDSMPKHEPIVSVLARASNPSDAEVAIQEVITAMAGDAIRAGLEVRQECDRLDDLLRELQQDLFRSIADFADRVRTIRKAYAQQSELAGEATRAVQAALSLSSPPPAEIAANHEVTPANEADGSSEVSVPPVE